MGGKVIYTCITGCYDALSQPEFVAMDYDYVCFADDATSAALGVGYGGKCGVWEIRPIPPLQQVQASTKNGALIQSRYPKLQPHKVLPEYEWSLWVDANIRILGDVLYKEADRCIASGKLVSQVKHPYRDCVYQELRELERQERLSARVAMREMLRLRNAGFPYGYGQYENNLILRRHGHPEVMGISDMWWSEFLEFPHRDQIPLMFVYWKKAFAPALLLPDGVNARNAGYLTLQEHPCAPSKRHGLGISLKRAAKLPLRPFLNFLASPR